MVSDAIASLLVLQERDSRHRSIERQLAQIPGEIDGYRRRIADALRQLHEAEAALRAMEAKRAGIEGAAEEIEDKIRRYKTQQMQVKKNEEYKALEHEIEVARREISSMEDAQLELLEQIDLEMTRLERRRAETARETAELEGHIATLERGAESLHGELDEATAAVLQARAGVDPATLEFYDFVVTQVRRAPYIVAIVEGKCGGCHLRVSSDILSQTRRGETRVRCDSCGRIVYSER